MIDIKHFKLLINDSIKNVQGDIIDISNDNGKTLAQLISTASQSNRIVHFVNSGFIETNNFTRFINSRSKYYRNIDLNKNDIYKIIDTFHEISLCVIDTMNPKIDINIIENIFNNMNINGTILLLNYSADSQNKNDLIIRKFLYKFEKQISCSEQLIKNGNRENHLIIRCIDKLKSSHISPSSPSNRALSIALVLKSGGIYDYNYVNNLVAGIKRHTTIPHEIVCLTDNPSNLDVSKIDRIIPLRHNYPKWWSKIELFRSDIFGKNRVFYIDLDTIIVDNIDDILQIDSEFCGLRDFYKIVTLGSGLMSWYPERVVQIYDNFVKNSLSIMANYAGGDQVWIDEQKPSIKYFQDIFINNIVSYKKHCIKNNNIIIPDDARIVCFHGTPRPHMIIDPIIKNHWKP